MKNKITNSTAKEILLYLLIGGGISFGVANPALLTPAIFIAHYMSKNKKVREVEVRNAFNYLKKRKYFSIKKKGNRIILELTNGGKKKAEIYNIQTSLFKRSKSKKWGGSWYLVMFDIEDSKKIKRDALRRVLQKSGFEFIQKSIWIYPHNCTKEINFVKKFFVINDDECRVVVSKDIGDDMKLRKKFSL